MVAATPRRSRGYVYLVQSRSFAEMLEATIRKYQNRTIEAAQEIRHLTRRNRGSLCAAPHPACGHLLPRAEKECVMDDELADKFARRAETPFSRRNNCLS